VKGEKSEHSGAQLIGKNSFVALAARANGWNHKSGDELGRFTCLSPFTFSMLTSHL
jgi:hypothetical protein